MEGRPRKECEEILNCPAGTAKGDTEWLVKKKLRKTKTSPPDDFDPLTLEEAIHNSLEDSIVRNTNKEWGCKHPTPHMLTVRHINVLVDANNGKVRE